MPGLHHVSDAGPLDVLVPRPSPPGTPHEGRRWVWAVDAERLANYLLPRDCPRVCWATPADGTHPLLTSPAARVVAVEHRWVPRLTDAGLFVHDLEPAGFTLLDPVAGYWVSEDAAAVRAVRRVDDCLAALAGLGVEVRLTTDLWPYVDAVVAAGARFSAIRMRNAGPRTT
ncbi:DUF6886 family protein [Kineosporia sp. A_224]|uniref:DUF6886 family protein n=1 Tax=Kineosporia sp. A_224 TaxID=1962180 RepID=UPI000B4C0CEB|nr:DUF6886 family protein [Kineosporia sp. A_224]